MHPYTFESNAPFSIEAIGDFASREIEGVNFAKILDSDLDLPKPPRFIFGPIDPLVSSHYYSQYGIGSVGVFIIDDACVSGNFLLHRGNIFFRSPQLNIHELYIKQEIARLAGFGPIQRQRSIPGQSVLLGGPATRVYGHWLIEYLPKIAILELAGFDVSSLRFMVPDHADKYVQKWLELLGVRSEQIVYYNTDSEILRPEKILLPTILHNGCRVSPFLKPVAATMQSRVSDQVRITPSPVPRKLFLTRASVRQTRALVNRETIEAAAIDAGFTVVSPELLSIEDQVRMFHGAHEIIGEYGSALHGSIFSPEGTVVCALRGTRLHPTFIQSGMGEVLGQPTGYVFGKTTGGATNYEFEIDEESFRQCLKLVFGGTRARLWRPSTAVS